MYTSINYLRYTTLIEKRTVKKIENNHYNRKLKVILTVTTNT